MNQGRTDGRQLFGQVFLLGSKVCTQHGRGKMIFFFFYGEQTILDPAGLVRTALAEVKGNF